MTIGKAVIMLSIVANLHNQREGKAQEGIMQCNRYIGSQKKQEKVVLHDKSAHHMIVKIHIKHEDFRIMSQKCCNNLISVFNQFSKTASYSWIIKRLSEKRKPDNRSGWDSMRVNDRRKNGEKSYEGNRSHCVKNGSVCMKFSLYLNVL